DRPTHLSQPVCRPCATPAPRHRSSPVPTTSARVLLFSPAAADPPTLHSFPTRRSSDLPHFWRVHIHSFRVGRRSSGDRRVSRRGDRKSTRLNSSHVSISYAVFCLKKKTRGWRR